jgi:hypothetical protein
MLGMITNITISMMHMQKIFSAEKHAREAQKFLCFVFISQI